MIETDSVQYSVIQRDEFFFTALQHPDWTAYIPIRGSFQCTIRGKTDTVCPGDVYIIPPDVPFQRTVLEPLLVHFIRFTLKAPEDFPAPWGKLNYKNPLRVEQTTEMLKNTPKLPAEQQKIMIRHCLSDLLLQYQYEQALPPSNGKEKDETVQKIMEYLNRNYAVPLSIGDLARQFNISPSGLIKKFKRAAGILPHRYLADLRIKHAKRLLVDTAMNISEIADRTGFESVYYFSKTFKKETGISPSEYRKNYLI